MNHEELTDLLPAGVVWGDAILPNRIKAILAAYDATGENSAAARLAQLSDWLASTGALPQGSSWIGELEAIVAGRGEADHEAHCNLRWPATLGTKDDHCDCAHSQRYGDTDRNKPLETK